MTIRSSTSARASTAAGSEQGTAGLGRKFRLLELERSEVMLFPLSWTLVHPITEESPLWGLTEADLRAAEFEFLVLVSGMDETFSQQVNARSSYKPAEIVWGHKFRNIFVPPDPRVGACRSTSIASTRAIPCRSPSEHLSPRSPAMTHVVRRTSIVPVLVVAAFTAALAPRAGAQSARAASQKAAQERAAQIKEFDAFVAKGMKDWGIPGLSVSVVKNDSVIFSKGYNVRALSAPGAVDDQTAL